MGGFQGTSAPFCSKMSGKMSIMIQKRHNVGMISKHEWLVEKYSKAKDQQIILVLEKSGREYMQYIPGI